MVKRGSGVYSGCLKAVDSDSVNLLPHVQLHQSSEDRSVLRYVYYFLARLLAESGAQGVTPGGGLPTPNWDALADLNLAGGTVVTRAEVVPQIITQLTAEARNAEPLRK